MSATAASPVEPGLRSNRGINLPDHVRLMVDASIDATAIVDHELQVVYFNDAYVRLSRLRPRELIERTQAGRGLCHELFGLETCTEACIARRVFESGRVCRADEVGSAVRELRLIVTGIPLLGENGHVTAVIEQYRDVTAESRMQENYRRLLRDVHKRVEEIQELDRLKTQFFQNISHELRTPLTLILAPLDTLRAQPGHDVESQRQLEVMRSSALRLLSMINSLLDLARLEAGKMRLLLTDIDPALLCRDLVHSAQQLAKQRGIKLTYDGPDRLALVPLDQEKVEKAILNLLSNALKFTGAYADHAAEVHVEAGIVDDRLVIAVRDTGIGIAEEDVAKIFQRFHQVDGSNERRFGGTGIGLALVKELVEFHMGDVRVDSQLGEGSSFQLRFPTRREMYPEDRLDRRRGSETIATERRRGRDTPSIPSVIAKPGYLPLAELGVADLRPTPERPVREETRAERPRILVADDDADLLSYLASTLEPDYEVTTTTDGEEAFAVARDNPPALIVSDVMLPGRSGIELLRALKRLPATQLIPVILVTAMADSDQRVAGIEQGAADYITKPFNVLELRARIRQLLKTRSLERGLAERNDYLAKLNFDLSLSKKEVFVQTIEALAFALEAKDPYTHGHSRRVSILSAMMARRMGLPDLDVERVRMCAVLHDIGKLGIPEHILQKEGELTPAEEQILRRHPEIGYRILESVDELADVNRCILLHHERFDGTGYPTGRKGADIPLESRIIAVADAYDAMTSDRPGRKAYGHHRAIDEIKSRSGTKFDPSCVSAFVNLYGDDPPVFPVFPTVLTSPTAAA